MSWLLFLLVAYAVFLLRKMRRNQHRYVPLNLNQPPPFPYQQQLLNRQQRLPPLDQQLALRSAMAGLTGLKGAYEVDDWKVCPY